MSDEIRVGANGKIMTAPLNSAEPASASAAWPAAWTNLGDTSEAGVRFIDSKTLKDISIWQSLYPGRRIITGRDARATFVLRNWNKDTVVFAFGGGEVTEPTNGQYRYEPPDAGEIDERMLGVEWTDGALTYRIILPRGMVVENVETNLQRDEAADLPITFAVIGENGALPWYLLTNDTAFEPTS